jgi:CheY-like chemotaxis protein
LFRSEKLAAAGQLIAGLAAELRSPLAVIEGSARQLIRREGEPLPSPELEPILAAAAKAANLVERLVAFSDPKGVASSVELNELLTGLLDFRRQEWRVRGVQCNLDLASHPVVVNGSPSQLQQAFLNLLMEAEQESAKGDRTLQVATSAVGKRAVVRIRFQAAHAASGERLPVVHGILLSHGGELKPSSDESRQGFDVFLPLAETARSPENGHAEPAASRVTALVVEPDVMARRDLVRLLGESRHRAVAVTNGEEALDLLERMRFDLVMCAVRLPGINWVELRRKCRQRAGAFVLLTEGLEAESAGAHTLRKPAGASELDALLRRIVGTVTQA